MSIYPKFEYYPETLFNKEEILTTAEELENYEQENGTLDYFVKKNGDIMNGKLKLPILEFSDNTIQNTAFDQDIQDDIIDDVLENTVKLTNINYNGVNTEIQNLNTNSLTFGGTTTQTQPFTDIDKTQIYINQGNITLHNTRINNLENKNEFTDEYKNKVDNNETEINTLNETFNISTNTLTFNKQYLWINDNSYLFGNNSDDTGDFRLGNNNGLPVTIISSNKINIYAPNTYIGTNETTENSLFIKGNNSKIRLNGEDQNYAFTDELKNKISNNETQNTTQDALILNNTNGVSAIENKLRHQITYYDKVSFSKKLQCPSIIINNETQNYAFTNTLKNKLESINNQTATAYLSMNDLIGISSIPNSTLIDIDHDFNLGQWINNNTDIDFFTGSGLYKYSLGKIEISIQVKLLNKQSYIITALTGLRNKLGEPGDEYRVIGIDFSLPDEDTSTTQYIDGGIEMKTSTQFEEYYRYGYSCSPFIIECNSTLQNNYKLMLKTRLKMQVSPSNYGEKDIKAVITIKKY